MVIFKKKGLFLLDAPSIYSSEVVMNIFRPKPLQLLLKMQNSNNRRTISRFPAQHGMRMLPVVVITQ